MIAKFDVGEALRDLADRVALGEADADDQVVVLPRERGHVRDVVGSGGGLDHPALDPELLLRPLEAAEGELVEAVVVELALVGDQADPELLLLGRGRRRRRRLVVVAAATGERENREEQGRAG